MVTKTLMPVLYRSGHRDTLKCTDHVCINQYDSQERKQPVAIMRRVNNQALFALVWPGKEDNDARTAFEVVASLPLLDRPRIVHITWLQRRLLLEAEKRCCK